MPNTVVTFPNTLQKRKELQELRRRMLWSRATDLRHLDGHCPLCGGEALEHWADCLIINCRLELERDVALTAVEVFDRWEAQLDE